MFEIVITLELDGRLWATFVVLIQILAECLLLNEKKRERKVSKTKIVFFFIRKSVSYLLSWTTSTWSLIIISNVLVVVSHPVSSVLIITVVLITLILNDSKNKVSIRIRQRERGIKGVEYSLYCLASLGLLIGPSCAVPVADLAECCRDCCDDYHPFDSLERPYQQWDSCVNSSSREL